MKNVELVPADFRYFNSGTGGHRDLDEESGESILVDSKNEDSDIINNE